MKSTLFLGFYVIIFSCACSYIELSFYQVEYLLFDYYCHSNIKVLPQIKKIIRNIADKGDIHYEKKSNRNYYK